MEAGSTTAIRAEGISLNDIPEKYRVQAAHGFAYYEERNEALRLEYMDYIRKEIGILCKRAMKSMPLLRFLMAEELVDYAALEEMLAKAIADKDFELTASLLDYQGKVMSPEKLRQRAQKEEEKLDELWEF